MDVDVVFERNGKRWRVPTFWNGGNKWTVRFAPPAAGIYRYRVESTDKTNTDLNNQAGQVAITPYSGTNPLFGKGPLRVKRPLLRTRGRHAFLLARRYLGYRPIRSFALARVPRNRRRSKGERFHRCATGDHAARRRKSAGRSGISQ